MRRFFATDDSLTLTAQRLVVAAVMFPHGAQKLLGWFGGLGIAGTQGFFATLGIPSLLGLLVIVGESLGAITLALGLATRLSAFGISAAMLGAMLMVHAPHGFFMNWFGTQAGEGLEFGILMLALSIPLVVRGGGRFALDRRMFDGSPIRGVAADCGPVLSR
jgi:putative oxidoreductase